MFDIAFDLTVADAQKYHPNGVSQAYSDIKPALAQHGFGWVQGSLYVSLKIWQDCSLRSRL